MTKLILGTAQFGTTAYGIKGDGLVSQKEIEKIAHVAWDGGIRTIHTSWQYAVPKFAGVIFREFKKITKDGDEPQYFMVQGDGINSLGKSYYSPDEIGAPLSYAQIPLNVLDGRWSKDIQEFKIHGTIIHARSVFLQGLLLMEDVPEWVSNESMFKIHDFWNVCGHKDLQPYEAALGYVLGLDEIDHVIVGVNSAKQLEQLLQVKPLKWDYDFSITDENVLDPRRWPK